MIRRFKWWEPLYPHVHWTDPVTGYEIQVRFNGYTGTWCGYVVLPEEHPWVVDQREFERDDKHVRLDIHSMVRVHGGWTFYSENTYGFDCAHYMDYQPAQPYNKVDPWGHPLIYWTFAMVRDEILRAAREIHALR